ncbi:MAG: helix-hairpin-helix domain-containing protein [Ruminococcus sp.]|nr:helix-hairpin-helix domain-containing protein [Ruminococcus sp.]
MNDSKMEKTLLLGAGLLFACSGMWKLYDVIFAPSEPVIIENTEVTDAVSTITGTVASSSKTKAASEPTSEEFIFLDLNTADVSELEKLSGIGAQTAERIVGYREEHGGFRNIEEIMNVSGIGEATFSDIKEHIFVVDPVYEMEPVTETEPVTEAPAERMETEPETEPVLTLEEAAPININSADKELLMLLPHVDEETAEHIIALREELGKFSHPYELLYVDDLTQPEVAEITQYVTV